MIRILKILLFVIYGFVGGSLSPWVLGWIQRVPVATPADAYAIANTYIVFTTIIFVGITLLLAVAGYVITQQFSAAKIAHEMQIIDELKEKLKVDERLGISLFNGATKNEGTGKYIEKWLDQRLYERLEKRLSESRSVLAQAQEESAVLEGLTGKMPNEGDAK